jgi:hypothetical protein
MRIQLLKQQKQHFKPLLKIVEKLDTVFAMALFYVQYCILLCLHELKSHLSVLYI